MNALPRSHTDVDDEDMAWDRDESPEELEKHSSRAPDDISKSVDESLGLQPISIRLQRTLIDDLKALGQLHGLGYQPLIRQVLTRFVDCEKRSLSRDRVAAASQEEEAAAAGTPTDKRRAA